MSIASLESSLEASLSVVAEDEEDSALSPSSSLAASVDPLELGLSEEDAEASVGALAASVAAAGLLLAGAESQGPENYVHNETEISAQFF